MTFRNKILELYEKDLLFRNELISKGKLSDGYDPEMEAIHISNANELRQLINEFGFPNQKLVGKKAFEAAWTIIQHSISNPSFMRFCLAKMNENDTNSTSIYCAYLTDRIAFFEGKPQHYGTQFDWDINGKMSPIAYDDLELVNQRRKKLGLNTLEEQTKLIQKQVEKENQKPPQDIEKRNQEFNLWRKKVGWI
jgi:hypothetical protein